MDLSFLKTSIPDLSFKDTHRKFFGKYLYKIVANAPGGRLINQEGDIQSALAVRLQHYKFYNHGGSWFNRHNRDLDKVDIAWLTFLKTSKDSSLENYKYRVEEPSIQIYTDTEDNVTSFLKTIDQNHIHYVTEIWRPANKKQLQILDSGKVLVKHTPKYQYKINFRDGNYKPVTKKQLLNYLDNLGDVVKISKSVRAHLDTDFPSLWGCYLYTNDLSITTFLQLIQPGIIRNVEELVAIE